MVMSTHTVDIDKTATAHSKAAGKPDSKPNGKPNGKESLSQQVDEWLARSCLQAKELPGKLVSTIDGRTIEFQDLDAKPVPEATVTRLFHATHGFAKLVDPKQLKEQPKYLHREGVRPHLYLPFNAGQPWRTWAADKKQPRRLFVEGAAKAACCCKFGFANTVGVLGCWGWRAVKHGLLVLPEFNDMALEDGHLYWIPDHDRKHKSVADILRASSAFARYLTDNRSVKMHVVWLPLLEGYDKVGVDDFLYHYSRGGKDLRAGRAALQEILDATPVWQDFENTEPGDAARWVSLYSPQFRYVGKFRSWLNYDGTRWTADDALQQQETLKQMYDNLLQDARDTGNSDLCGRLLATVTEPRIAHVGKLIRSDPAVVTAPEQFDAHPLWINCPNGVLELPDRVDGRLTGKLRFRAHDAADMLTKQISVNYEPEAKCPTFERAMRFWVQEDLELSRLVQQLAGISMTGLTREQLFILLWGDTETGKSTFVETMRRISGSYSKVINAEDLLVRRNGKPEERKLAALPGVRLAVASETENKGILDENFLKMLTGEDSATARQLYKEQFDFMPEAKMWLRTNNKPEVRSTDDSLWRRLVVLPFGHRVSAKQKDPNLREKLVKELPGIFAWMVRGYLDYAQHGLVVAKVVEEAKLAYKKEQDVLQRFIEERCVLATHTKDKPCRVRRDQLYTVYVSWCDAALIRNKLTMVEFRDLLTKRYNLTVSRETMGKKSNGTAMQEWMWLGINLQNANDIGNPKY